MEHTWIPLSDGARLSARLWLPEGAGAAPAVLEYIPYRKRDDTRWRDEPMHGYFASRGFPAVRVDLRGSGTSDGVLTDEYSDQEWTDGLEALRWIASQPWCDGNVGLIGKSWGGINALQIAALRPPELRCVVSVCSSDDRWATDAHWMGGCLLNENLTWASVLLTVAMRPQDPELVGEGWRRTWLERMERTPLFATRWLRHSTRDEYWARGSVSEAYGRIGVPVLAVGGWADAYSDTVPRLLEGLPGLVRGWVGPWAHVYPHNGEPGPAGDFLGVAARWWDRWLRGDRAPAAEGTEARYRVWMTEGGGAPWREATARGRWVAEDAWPSARIEVRESTLGPDEPGPVPVPWTGLGGLAAGAWCPFTLEGLALEQTPDDEASVVMDRPPLEARLEILGAPEVDLELSSARPHGMVAVRLCDVAPDGTSVRVSHQILDLQFRDGFGERVPLEAGRRFGVRVRLGHCAHAVPVGHRIRVAVASSYWPIVWPPAEPVRLRLFPSQCRLRLPVRPVREEDEERAARWAGTPSVPGPSAVDAADRATRSLSTDPESGRVCLEVRQGWGPDGEPHVEPVDGIGLESGWGIEERFSVVPAVPRSARAEIRHVAVSRRPGWSTRLEVRLEQERTARGHRVRARVIGSEGGVELFRRELDEEIDG